ncbi:LysR substrate-binding domain-containing protein [Ruegeria jejuensis]|uniref:LysR substrate-binding domain-containing protein n=1 Tax=Ruegeria jejuensis TaxID=3233338 RepID=UPI00355C4CEC
MKDLPPLSYLRSFEVSARHMSFTDAATEMNLTQAAVSGHVRALEQFIGGPLFNRHPRSLSLTSLGKAYLPSVQQSLENIEQATKAILKGRGRERVVVSCPISAAETWMADLLTQFSDLHPEVQITIHARIWEDEVQEVADIVVTDVPSEKLSRDLLVLWQDRFAIVASPDFRVDGLPLTTPSQLSASRLIHNLGRPEAWYLAAAQLGQPHMRLSEDYQSNTYSMAIRLTERGLGVGIVPSLLARSRLRSGHLVAPFGLSCETGRVTVLSDPSLLNSKPARELHDFLIKGTARIRSELDTAPETDPWRCQSG